MSALWSGFYFHGLHIPDILNLSKFEIQMVFIFPLYIEKHCNRHLASSFSQIFLKVNFQKKDYWVKLYKHFSKLLSKRHVPYFLS